MRIKIQYMLLLSFFSVGACAGDIQIQTKDSLIRNDVFDAKRERIDAYREAQALQQLESQSLQLDISNVCMLLRREGVIYFCATNGHYYKQVIDNNNKYYQQLSPVKTLKMAK
ncbi:hypothetical protein PCNPT3_10920 [Psychromonas sp. CNPT3]|uniref:hypothetical protein n=1 Tax=Psychromonas sp. CNPT3 TaxID=314282 RepID=UPI00006E4268|nr:hypothetical protein [Psychromonas sp. CNPT3]AGH82120.1 hypothetical protein PCNPT3_10920 [Psychromonas sp. CNPT3]